jgi:starvation-inducible DNA-binding protein
VTLLNTKSGHRNEGNTMSNITPINTTVSGMSTDSSAETIQSLQDRLTALLDLHLTLKHIHWNVVGMNFMAVHEMLDPQVDKVRAMADVVAERIATLGGSPSGTPGSIVAGRSWDDYALDREPTARHLAALDSVYNGVIGDHRVAQAKAAGLDPVSEDMLIGQLAELELFQWFVRAHLQDSTGDVVHRSAD